MTNSAHAVHTAKEYTGYASAAADKLKAWHEEAKKLEKTGETLGDFDEIMKALTWTSKLSAGLGAVSFGLSVVAVLMPVKSIEEEIFDAVQGLQRQVKDLDAHINTKLKEVEKEIKNAVADDLLKVIHGNNIITATKYVADYHNCKKERGTDKKSEEKFKEAETRLLSFEGGKLIEAINAFETAVTSETYTQNILQMTFDLSYADPREMIRVGTQYHQMAVAALSAYVSWDVLRKRHKAEKEGRPFSEDDEIMAAEVAAGDEDRPEEPAGTLANIADAVKTQVHRCYDQKERNAAVKRYFETELYEQRKTLMADYQAYTDLIVKELHTKFPYLNFTAILYLGWSGASRHGFHVAGSEYGLIKNFQFGYLKDKDTEHDETDLAKKRNLLIYFAPRTVPGDPPLHTLPNLPRPSPTRNKALQTISATLNASKYSYTPLREIDLPNYIKTVFPSSMGRKPHHWGGDMVWGCYCDTYFERAISNTSMPKTQHILNWVMGVTSQNRIGLVAKNQITASDDNDTRHYQFLAIWDDAH